MLKLNLQLFAEGEGDAFGVMDPSGEENENQEVREESETDTEEALQSDGKEEKRPFSELIKSEYKEDFTEEINKIFSKRYKEEARYKSKYDNLKEAFIPLMERYETESVEELIEKISGDERSLRAEAMEKGMNIEDYKKLLTLQADSRRKTEYIARLEKEKNEREKARAHNELLSRWNSEAEEVKKEFPDFSLNEEVRNTTFMNALRVGVSVADAYKIAHPDVYRKYVAQTERKAALEAVRAKNSRPTELGASAHPAARELPKADSLSDKEVEEIRNRVMKGEKISFS